MKKRFKAFLFLTFIILSGAHPLEETIPASPYLACRASSPDRFFEANGGNYNLQLGNSPAPIIGRGTWGAKPAITQGRLWAAYPKDQPACQWIKRITVHHTVGDYTPLSLQKFHQNIADPKADIAYHFFISKEGTIYEGRPLGRIGSHSEADNGNNVGIALNGNYQEQKPPQVQLDALKTLLAALDCPCYEQPVWTHRQRKKLKFPTQSKKWTTCPGDFLQKDVMKHIHPAQ